MGIVFSAGWTPCIGPVYGTVLTLAANSGDVGWASGMLAVYSLGLGVPFLLTALLLDGAQTVLRRFQRHMRAIELTSGAFFVAIGVLVATSQLQVLSQRFAVEFSEFSIGVEEQAIEFFTGISAEVSGVAETEDVSQPASVSDEVGLSVGSIAPDFTAATDTGESVTLSQLRGNVVLLNFWATWCGPCRIEMPELQTAYEQNADQSFVVLAINNAESLEDVAGFRQELALTFPIALDGRALVQREYGIMSYPSTFILDRDGRILARHFGPLTDGQVRSLLATAGIS
jgi:cytochrome c-type biogenesis protein